MKTSTQIDVGGKIIGEEKTIELVAKAGFDAWDFSMFAMCDYDWDAGILRPNSHPLAGNDYLKFARRLKQVGLDNGIVCNQSHAPFPTRCKPIRDNFKRAIECTAEAGGEICIIHPDNYSNAQENAEMYLELLPFAKEHNVKIATENMWSWDHENDHARAAACSHHDDFRRHIDIVNDPFLVACLDIGHAEMKGLDTTSRDMILTLGDSLQALHIHDNDKWHDSHEIPFSMDIDFTEVVKALKEINYKGYFTLEADHYLHKFDAGNIADGIKDLYNAARRLADMFEAL